MEFPGGPVKIIFSGVLTHAPREMELHDVDPACYASGQLPRQTVSTSGH